MNLTISNAIKKLLEIVQGLQREYPYKRFTLDGRLVGDIGEIIVQDMYEVELSKGLQKHHDGVASDGRQVQIKTTMQNSLTFPCDHIPDYYLAIKIHSDDQVTEIFNGPGIVAYEAVKNRKQTKTNLHSVDIKAFISLNSIVKFEDRIPLRSRT